MDDKEYVLACRIVSIFKDSNELDIDESLIDYENQLDIFHASEISNPQGHMTSLED